MSGQLRFFAVLGFGILLVGMVGHFWVTDRLGVLRLLYPLEAALVAPTLSCTRDAPQWMREALYFSLVDGESPAGQIAHVTPVGAVHECHYGWVSMPLLSAFVTEKSRFRYASMTKLLTADLVLRVVHQGRLSLDSKLLELLELDGFPDDERLQEITVESLLRHSAGFDRMRSIDSMVEHGKKPWCPSQLEKLAEVRLDFEPGQRYAYSNLNYCLLGAVLEKVTGQTFRDLMEQEYGLASRDIRFVDGPYLSDEVRYDFRNSEFYTDQYWRYFDFEALSSSAGLSGSAGAFARLLAELRYEQGFMVTQAGIQPICNQGVFRGCYGYAVFAYQPAHDRLRVHVQPGFLYASPSVAILDDKGGVTVWVGSGMRLAGDPTDPMVEVLYQALDEFYSK
ncbi:MAG: serine hydrolase domain-containing protein [Pseudomonas sp.]|uniref:serine hydrolase domain-containing protein n=1 Tax=Pseudomonas sp. TaxID=306 RepID=UPI003D0B352F